MELDENITDRLCVRIFMGDISQKAIVTRNCEQKII
jgi:hypothetical protein